MLEDFGNTGGKRDWAKGGWRVVRFAGFVYGNNGGRFPAGGKGMRRQDQDQLKVEKKYCCAERGRCVRRG